jgi:tetratricopeptide (TPR) repeat protein
MMKRRTTTPFLAGALVMTLAACAGEQTGEVASELEFERPEGMPEVVMELPVTTASEEAMSYFMQGQRALDMGRALDARDLFAQAVEADPNFAHAYLNLASSATSLDEFRTNLMKAEETAGGATETERMLIEIARKGSDGDMEGQLALVTQLAAAEPTSPRALLALATVQANMAETEMARATAMKAIEVSPNFVPAYMALGNSYLFAEPIDLTKAAEYIQKAVDLEPGESFPYDLLGDAYRAQGEFEQARDAYTRAAELDPTNGSPLQQRGHVNLFLGDYEAARADYDAGIELGRANEKPAYTVYRTMVNVVEGDPAAAIAELSELVEAIDGMDIPERTGLKINALTNQALVALHTGMIPEAEEALAQRTELARMQAAKVGTDESSRGWEASIAFFDGRLAIAKGDYETAMSKAEELMTIVEPFPNPRKNEGAHMLFGMTHLAQGNFADAITHLEQASQDAIYVNYQLARAHEGAGNTDEAMMRYEKIANWNFADPNALLVRAEAQSKIAG